MLPIVYVTGIVNPKGTEDTGGQSFHLTRAQIERIAATKPHSMALMVEHNYDVSVDDGMRAIGNIARFWTAADGKLWAVAMINPRSRYGPRTIRQLLMGEFGGFSPGMPFNTHLYKTKNEVDLLGVCEISLVKFPDDPASVIISMDGADALRGWPRVETALRSVHAKFGTVPPDHKLDEYILNKDKWAAAVQAAQQIQTQCTT
jgi:hypothetical protein